MLNRFLKAINPIAPIPLTERIALFLYIRLLDPFLASPPPLTVIRVILVSFHCLPKLIFLFCTKGLNFGASGRSVSLPPIPPVRTRVYCYTQWVGGLSFLKTCCMLKTADTEPPLPSPPGTRVYYKLAARHAEGRASWWRERCQVGWCLTCGYLLLYNAV